MNHYETLGLKPNASAEEIKSAWRRKAAEHHPDREGGDAAQMARVNAAYACLGDAARRQAYDAAGCVDDDLDVEREAGSLLTRLFSDALDHGSNALVSDVRAQLLDHRSRHAAQLSQVKVSNRKLAKQRESVLYKGLGTNIAHRLIDDRLQQLKSMEQETNQALAMIDRALVLLDEYESLVDEPPATTYMHAARHATGGMVGEWLKPGFFQF